MPIYEKLMGNPFVDAGVSGICEWLGRNVQPEQVTKDDLEQVVNDIAPIMQTKVGWGNLHSIFPNSVLTNPSHNKRDRVALLKEECTHYLDTMCEMNETGDCMGCGRRDANNFLLKKDIPLTGSGPLRNFFPAFAEGAGYCSACAFAIQLSPLVFMATGGQFLALHSNSWKALKSWARVCVGDVRKQHLQQDITGCFNPGYANPRNGMFYMAREMTKYQEMRPDEKIPMQVYCFRNYNDKPELEIFYMPTPVFKFLRIVYMGKFNKVWQEIVRSGYHFVDWDKVKSEEDYKNSPNRVYENLLQDISILGYFLNKRIRKPRGNWELLSLYLKEVREMNELRLNALKQVGDFIAESIQKTNKVSRLRNLERARSYTTFRNVLRYVIRDRIREGENEPLFSLDDYVEHLFPEPQFWSETRDLLIFRIYEKLHDWLVKSGAVDDEDDEDEENNETDESQEEN